MNSDIEIARQADIRPIVDIASNLGIPEEYVETYGKHKAKINLKINSDSEIAAQNNGKLILVSAMTPTTAGEGKTTTTIGLTDALALLDHSVVTCMREPSLGPCFGMKGGGAGGGMSQVIPMEDINLHFNGDFHAITSAHNLIAAILDNHLHHGNKLNIDPRKIIWQRVLDVNDRALRQVVIGLGGPLNSVPRQDSFSITAASEIMAIFCLSNNFQELRKNIDAIIVAYNFNNHPVTVSDLKVTGALMALLKDAIKPNLVQTLEGNPVFVHGGPFANIAHGCNSIIATKLAMKLADYTITEAGFGTDLGAEKFFNIKCRKADISPNAAVVVATIKSLKVHGGAAKEDVTQPNPEAVRIGIENLKKHIENTHSILDFLVNHEMVEWVKHPDLETHPDHEIAKRILPKGSGSIVAFGIKGGREAGKAFIESVQLASHLANVGDAKTLLIHPGSTTHSHLSSEAMKEGGLTDDMIRLSVGLEDINDITKDFERGFRAVKKLNK